MHQTLPRQRRHNDATVPRYTPAEGWGNLGRGSRVPSFHLPHQFSPSALSHAILSPETLSPPLNPAVESPHSGVPASPAAERFWYIFARIRTFADWFRQYFNSI